MVAGGSGSYCYFGAVGSAALRGLAFFVCHALVAGLRLIPLSASLCKHTAAIFQVLAVTKLNGMSDQLKLDGDGNCPTCNQASIEEEHVKCYGCNSLFHAICAGASPELKVANKTTVNCFLLPSTKKNIVFYYNTCLTRNEIPQTMTKQITR